MDLDTIYRIIRLNPTIERDLDTLWIVKDFNL